MASTVERARACTKMSAKPSPSKPRTGTNKNNKSDSERKRRAQPPFPLYRHAACDGGGNDNHDCDDGAVRSSCTFEEGFASVAALLRGRKNIVVLTGAGISVSCGIPDFRSRGTGLYSTLDAEGLGLSSAEELFDLEVFKEDPRPFYRFARSLYPGSVQPSDSHRFLALLEEKGMLLRIYTQNIDGLEEIAGVSPKRIVHAHGSLSWAQCTKCRHKFDATEIADDVQAGTVPRCTRPVRGSKRKDSMESIGGVGDASSASDASARATLKRIRRQSPRKKKVERRTDGVGENDCAVSLSSQSLHISSGNANQAERPCCGGVIKPGVTFFGEKLGDKVRRCLESDRAKADALIVMGTSLSVAPMSKVIQYLSPSIPRLLINRNIVKAPKHCADTDDKKTDDDEQDFRDGYVFDACMLGYCDDVTRALVKKLRWLEEEEKLPASSRVESSLPETEGSVLSVAHAGGELDNGGQGLYNHPTERVFRFPGAVLTNDDSDSEMTYREVAHCDGCEKEIIGAIFKCSQCFDFDLCMSCHPKIAKQHFLGKHTFVAE